MTQEIESVRECNEFRLVSSLPEILLIYGHPRMYAGAEPLVRDLSTLDLDSHRWVMSQMFFSTPTRIHGLLHYQSPSQLFFLGYKCGKCDQVYLVPEVKDTNELANAMRHACHE